MYALGGHDCPASNPSVCRTETVERYDPGTDTWTLVMVSIWSITHKKMLFQIASINVGRDAIGCAFLGDKLIAVGGYDGNSYLNTVEEYDPESNEWITISPMTCSRAGACVVSIPNVTPTSTFLLQTPPSTTV